MISDESTLLASTDRILAYRQRYHPAIDPPEAEENVEMHDSALFDLIEEIDAGGSSGSSSGAFFDL